MRKDLGIERGRELVSVSRVQAHAISDEVLRARDPATHDDCNLPYHLRWVWDGRPLDGKDVLVRCYHGLGDTLQFARFLPALARRTASLHVEAQPALVPLLRMLPGPGKLIPFQTASPAPPRVSSRCIVAKSWQ